MNVLGVVAVVGGDQDQVVPDERLLDVAESILGPEIYSNPVHHARIKPPRRFLPAAATDANVAAMRLRGLSCGGTLATASLPAKWR